MRKKHHVLLTARYSFHITMIILILFRKINAFFKIVYKNNIFFRFFSSKSGFLHDLNKKFTIYMFGKNSTAVFCAYQCLQSAHRSADCIACIRYFGIAQPCLCAFLIPNRVQNAAAFAA